MTDITPEQIAKLTDRHKIVVKDTGAPEHIQPVELELWTDEHGLLRDSLGFIVRYRDGSPGAALGLIIDIIEPPHEFKYGDVIGHPSLRGFRAVYLPSNGYDTTHWLSRDDWETQEWADERLANGWVIDPDGKQGRAKDKTARNGGSDD